MKKFDKLIFIAVISSIAFLYYGPFLNNYFVWDDFFILDNFISCNLIDSLLYAGSLRVFGGLLLWFNFLVSGYTPVYYNLIEIGLHVANSGMLLILLYSLSDNRLFSLFTAIIFAASSVGCDAILWKAALLTSTGFFFYILILYLYVHGNKGGGKICYYLALTAFMFAMFNKEEIASVPFMIIFIEMLFFRRDADVRARVAITKRVLPYFLVIVVYILLSLVASRMFNIHQEQFDRLLSFRPLHTLLSGFTSFFISPNGKLTWEQPFIYITTLFILLCLFFIKDRKWLVFGLGWVFLTFLPQSLTGLTRFDAPYLLNSISRHLYLPSVGPAIVFSTVLLYLKEHFTQKVFIMATSLFFTVFIFVNYERVEIRGKQWQEEGERMKDFLHSLKRLQPTFPENAYICIILGPEGSYTLPAVRAFYKNPKIYWTYEPRKDAYIYLYMNGRFVDKHESVMQMSNNIPSEYIGYVLKFYELKQLEKEKLEFLRALSASHYNDPDIHYRLALIYRDMGMKEDAESEFKAALIISPLDMKVHYHLGLLYISEKRYKLANEELLFVAQHKTSTWAPMANEFLKAIRVQEGK